MKLLFVCFISLITGFSLGFLDPAAGYCLEKRIVDNISVDHGLSNNSVISIFQDHFGFMWFSTYDGLNRYDGYNFKIFRNKWGDENSIPSNHVGGATEDHSNRIWVGTDKGLIYYDYSDSKIHPVYYRQFNSQKIQKVVSRINSVLVAANGDILIATEESGLLVCRNGQSICEQQKTWYNAVNYNASRLAEDKKNNLYLFIADVGLCLYNVHKAQFTLLNKELKKGVNGLNYDAANNQIYLSTEVGIYKYSISNNTLSKFSDYKLSNNNVMQVFINDPQEIWVATDGGGINIINTASRKISYLLPGDSNESLSSGTVYTIYKDRQSRKWIATLRGGINIIDQRNHLFNTIKHNPQNKNSLVHNSARSFCEEKSGNIWIGTTGGGVSYWNPATNRYTNFKHDEANPHSISSDFVMSIVCDHRNNIWMASFNGGIDLYNRKNNSFKHYKCYNTATRWEEKNAWKLFEDSYHRLWASNTRGGALFLFNPVKNRFDLYDANLVDVNTFYEDSKKALWVGTNKALVKIDYASKKHTYFITGGSVYSIYEDSNKNFWVGTDGAGLLLFNRGSKSFIRYTTANGLPSNSVINMLEDNAGNIWCSTFNGLSKLNPRLKQFKNYFTSDGLQSNQFNHNAALKLRSGELIFGGIKGFNRFNPDQIKPIVSVPPIFLTALRINNIPIEEDQFYKGKKSITDLGKIQLPYDKSSVSIDFVALEYSFPYKISYAYYMEGWDRGWNNAGKIKTANYSRLSEGNYILHIKSTNTDGIWSNNQKVIYITILPPWYRSWWAYCLYAGSGILAFWLYFLYRSKQTRLEHEVEIAYIKNEKDQELNEKKLTFFTNISHEFRTPLALIINPVKDMLKTNTGDPDLNIVYRNARRLLSLVDQLMLFRKTESENDILKVVKLNFASLAYDVFQCFLNQAKIKNISYNFVCNQEELPVYADREKVEIALFNLISNALKFTPEHGFVRFEVKETESYIEVFIEDSGCGLEPGLEDKLYEKFYRAQRKENLKMGFGIGLYLVKNFADSHHGSVTYESEIGRGTVFKLAIRKGRAHFEGVMIFEDVNNGSVYLEELMENLPQKADAAHTFATAHNDFISDLPSILIIDDNDEIRQYLKQIFKTVYKTYEAPDGETGLAVIKEVLPDVVICDVVMRGMSGIELCTIVKNNPVLNHIPIVLLTANLTPEFKLLGTEAGIADYISKPFEKDFLIARLNSILKNRNDLQEYFYNEITLKSNNLKISEESKEFLDKCIFLVEKNIKDNTFNKTNLAIELGMSNSNLYKKVKALSGQSVNSFIRFIRLRKSARLLIDTEYNVNEVAYNVGINDVRYFREQFFKLFGSNPSDFIKKYRSSFGKKFHVDK